MQKKKLVLTSFLNSFGVFVYTANVAWLLFNGESLFDGTPSFLIPLFMLLLFMISAVVTGFLILAKPLQLYFSNARQEAAVLLLLTVAWLVAYSAAVAGAMIIVR